MNKVLPLVLGFALAGYTAPQVNHAISAFAASATPQLGQSLTVIVWGEVAAPKKYSLPAGAKLTDAIAKGGGFTRYAARHHIFIKRGDRTYVYNLHPSAMERINPVIQDGDLILVPSGAPVL